MHLLCRLAEWSCACMATLGHSHPIQALLGGAWEGSILPLSLSMAGLSPAVVHHLVSPAKDALVECAEFTETIMVLSPKGEPGNRLVDVFPKWLLPHLAPQPSDDRYDNYIKSLDRVLDIVHGDLEGIYMVSDASTSTKGAVQAALASWFSGVIPRWHTLGAGPLPPMQNWWPWSWQFPPPWWWVGMLHGLNLCHGGTGWSLSVLRNSGQDSSLAACAVQCRWFKWGPLVTVHLWHVPSRAEWKVHHVRKTLKLKFLLFFIYFCPV